MAKDNNNENDDKMTGQDEAQIKKEFEDKIRSAIGDFVSENFNGDVPVDVEVTVEKKEKTPEKAETIKIHQIKIQLNKKTLNSQNPARVQKVRIQKLKALQLSL